MIVRNAFSGALHDVPDHLLYELGTPVYDGFGYPVAGFWDDALNVVKKVAAPALSLVNPAAGAASLVSALAPAAAGVLRAISPSAPAAPRPVAAPPVPMPMAPMPMAPMPPPAPAMPPGWQPAPNPYAARAPQRLYLRCSTWPGPPGLTPMLPPGAPVPTVNVVQQAPATAVAAPHRVHHAMSHHRR